MKLRTTLVALGMLALATAPSYALFCDNDDEDYGTTFSSNSSLGGRYDEQLREQLDTMRLKQEGVDVASVDRWNGCIRAFVRKPEGGQEMQYFDPRSFRRLQ